MHYGTASLFLRNRFPTCTEALPYILTNRFRTPYKLVSSVSKEYYAYILSKRFDRISSSHSIQPHHHIPYNLFKRFGRVCSSASAGSVQALQQGLFKRFGRVCSSASAGSVQALRQDLWKRFDSPNSSASTHRIQALRFSEFKRFNSPNSSAWIQPLLPNAGNSRNAEETSAKYIWSFRWVAFQIIPIFESAGGTRRAGPVCPSLPEWYLDRDYTLFIYTFLYIRI